MRKHDETEAKMASAQGREVRAHIQDEAKKAGRKLRAAEVRASEQSRQWDRQREDIHPEHVLEQLASIETKKRKVTPFPKATPDADPDRPVRVLPIRTLRKEPQP
jgi:hypothetical protein